MVFVEVGFGLGNVYAEYDLDFAVEKHHNISLNSPWLSNHVSSSRALGWIFFAEKIRRSDWSLTGQATREFSYVVVLFGRWNWKYQGMVGLYLLMDRDLFDGSDWSRRMDFDWPIADHYCESHCWSVVRVLVLESDFFEFLNFVRLFSSPLVLF